MSIKEKAKDFGYAAGLVIGECVLISLFLGLGAIDSAYVAYSKKRAKLSEARNPIPEGSKRTLIGWGDSVVEHEGSEYLLVEGNKLAGKITNKGRVYTPAYYPKPSPEMPFAPSVSGQTVQFVDSQIEEEVRPSLCATLSEKLGRWVT